MALNGDMSAAVMRILISDSIFAAPEKNSSSGRRRRVMHNYAIRRDCHRCLDAATMCDRIRVCMSEIDATPVGVWRLNVTNPTSCT
jgi:hypothetical protein